MSLKIKKFFAAKTLFLLSALLIVHLTLNTVQCYPQTWSPLGSGIGTSFDFVRTVTIYNNELIAGGRFTTAGGVSANRIAKWNGTSWSPLGSGVGIGINDCPWVLTVFNNELIAGGKFTTAGGASANYIAKWNGTSWSTLGSGMNSWVYSLTVYNNELIAGGLFDTAGGVIANRIAKWNGTSWSPLGSGMDDVVYALTVFNNELIAGGEFTTAGGVSASLIAKWNGTTWSPLGSGIGINFPPVWLQALTVFNNELIAGGSFTTAGGVSAYNIAKWNGTLWSPLGSGIIGTTADLIVYNNELIAGGWFSTAGGVSANHIAKWNGTLWSPLGSGMSGTDPFVSALTIFNNELISGGDFTTAGGVSAKRIAKWTEPIKVNPISIEIPSDYKLHQNYPNPFNPLTKIKFEVPKTSPVKISVFDVTGREVAVLVNETLNSGVYETTFDASSGNGSGLTSGVYFFRMDAGGFNETKTMILLK